MVERFYIFRTPVLANLSQTICVTTTATATFYPSSNLIYHSDVAVAVAVVFQKLASIET